MKDARKESAVPIGDILTDLIDAKEREAVRPIQRLQAAWATLQAAGRLEGTRIAGYRSGAAIIEVKSPPLCAELAQFRRREILGRLREELAGDPPLDELRFRLGAW